MDARVNGKSGFVFIETSEASCNNETANQLPTYPYTLWSPESGRPGARTSSAHESTGLATKTKHAYYPYVMAIPGNSKTFHLACMDGDTAAVQVIFGGCIMTSRLGDISQVIVKRFSRM